MRLLAIVAFLSLVFSIVPVQAQEIQRELFDLEDFFSNIEKFDFGKKMRVSQHLLSLATGELERLDSQRSRGQLDENGISRMEMLSLAIEPINGRRTTRAELRAFLEDSSNARMIYESIGQDRISAVLLSRVKDVIKSKLANQFDNSFTPLNVLNDDAIRESLDLTTQQQSKYEQVLVEARDGIRYGNKETFDQFDQLYSKHLNDLLLLLRPTQRESAKRLIGQPVKWFKARSKLEMLVDREHQGVFMAVNGKFGFAPDGRPMHDLAPQELKELKVPHVYRHLYPVFGSHFFAGELDLTEDQFEKMRKVPGDVVIASRYEEQRLDEFLVSDEIEYPSVLESIFVEHQLEWFRNIEFQILTVKHRFSFGLMHPRAKQSLEISSEQSDRINDLSQIFERDAKELAKELQEQRKAAEEEFQKEISELLTKDQKEKLKNWGSGRK